MSFTPPVNILLGVPPLADASPLLWYKGVAQLKGIGRPGNIMMSRIPVRAFGKGAGWPGICRAALVVLGITTFTGDSVGEFVKMKLSATAV